MGSSVSMKDGEAECTSAYPRHLSVEGSTEVWKALPCEDVTDEMGGTDSGGERARAREWRWQ